MLSFNILASLAICVQTELQMHEHMCKAIIIIKINVIIISRYKFLISLIMIITSVMKISL